MNLYSYGYLTHNSGILDDFFIFIGIMIGITILVSGFKYARNRTNLRYRNVLITMVLFAILIICLEVGRIQNQQSSQSQIGQTAQIMRNISSKDHIPLSNIYTSSTTLNNGMTIKAGKHFYQVNLNNNDNSTYTLSPTHPINHQMNYVHHGGLNFNLNNGKYLNIAVKLLIGFVMLVVQINLAGKSNLAPSNAIDQLQNYVLGGIVGGVIYNQAITILQFIIIILIWSIIIFGSKILITQSDFFKTIFIGRPHVLINHGLINVNAALASGMSANDLVFKLRSAGVNDFQKVKRVTLEQNGQLSISRYNDPTSVNFPIITDGTINDDVLTHIHKDRKWLLKLLELKHHQLKDVYLGQIINGDLVLTLYPQHNNRIFKYLPSHRIDISKFLKNTKDHLKNTKHHFRI
ncbi:DUF3290 family protein [Acetilactobacillus jinshanensis]|uniref:DUF3290 family protein n=1 Tax=Acetilactobacillus jinshanensis TaxID=1720083 RepID=A0A4P6ZK92_9LACO|nr:DUF3290 family protein [Acetilactobacillus jinshanensis]QBP17660.1 DUF3290 family protein [Acetilactobacillus jinshanensis]URL61797.1 DUF3290 family protein [uncultured bacterium]